ncbi:hypothetical protein L596_017283 [Steinernema carpocapsae]|uniref:Uncharacterized protein n=1 Tax=Steinernema carpocapsae TaxID=34508 RepID=A0A4U5N164_STECR|nr:hypothetical protein L596_017283 [Steinernema carpocapsae]
MKRYDDTDKGRNAVRQRPNKFYSHPYVPLTRVRQGVHEVEPVLQRRLRPYRKEDCDRSDLCQCSLKKVF